MSKTQVDSDFLSMGTQSGIKAGDGGFQVDVKGDTTQTGCVISSSQAAVEQNLNSFATGGLTERQRAIVKSLRLRGSEESQNVLGALENEKLIVADIEVLCTLINDEFMMEGVLPNFEPNAYGLELEALLDVVNRTRIRS